MSKIALLVTVMLRFKIFHHFQTFSSGTGNMYVINLTCGKWLLIHSMHLSARLDQNYNVHKFFFFENMPPVNCDSCVCTGWHLIPLMIQSVNRRLNNHLALHNDNGFSE